MRPVDARLLRYAASARQFFLVGSVLALVQAACTIAFAWLVSQTVVDAIAGAALPVLSGRLGALLAVVLVRSAVVWLTEVNAARGATLAKSELRQQVFGALARLGPAWLAKRNSAAVVTTVTSGLDALDTYFAKYLPQLILTVLVTPVMVVVLLISDVTSGVIVLLTLPLIPVFMVLIGWATEAAQKAQWQQLTRLSTAFLDVVEGLSTLKVFGRERRQVARIRAVTSNYRSATMKVLRLSFLSSFALELAASLSVALVAVSIGLRLVSGDLGFGVGLFVLMLAPEAFLPLRQVGAQFHAAADGVAATGEVFAILGAAGAGAGAAAAGAAGAAAAGAGAAGAAATVGVRPGGRSARAGVNLEHVVVSYVDESTGEASGALVDLSATFPAGALSVVSGPSGAGKSSLVAAMLGFVPFTGRVTIDDPAALQRPLVLADIAWAGQTPGLLAGSILDNVTLGSSAPSLDLCREALHRAAADDLDPVRVLGVHGSGLSGGQAARVAVARAIYRVLERALPILVLDEPSSALDATTEARLIDNLHELTRTGLTVIVVSHRDAFRLAADHVVTLGAQPVHADPRIRTRAIPSAAPSVPAAR